MSLLGMLTPPPASFDLPPDISTHARQIDDTYDFIWWFSVIFAIGMYSLTIYWCWKYRRRPGHKAEKTGHYPRLEIAWTIIPCFFIVYLFHIGFASYIKTAIAADDAIEIRAKGQQWLWTFTYPNGRSEPDELYVPINKPIKFLISSSDVLHAFYIPAARLKKDAVPGMYTMWTFTPTALGDYPIYCAEYCGAPAGDPAPRADPRGGFFPGGGHSGMMAVMHVVSWEKYDQIMHEAPKIPDDCKTKPNPEGCWGEKLYTKHACVTCHTVDGAKRTGPTWKGMYGHPVDLAGVGTKEVDDDYIRESILKPQAKIVKGYENAQMPPYTLSDPEITALTAYMKTLK